MGRHSNNSQETLPEVGQDTLLNDFEKETRGRRRQSKLRRRVRAGVAIASAVLAYNAIGSFASDSPNSNTVVAEAPADGNNSGSNAGGSNEKAPSASPSQNMDKVNCDISNAQAYAGTESIRVELDLKNTGKVPATYVVSEYNMGKDGADGTFGDPLNAEGTDPSKTTFEVPSTLIGQEVVVYGAVETQGTTETELCGTIAVQGSVEKPSIDFVTDNTVPNPMPR